MTTGSTIPENDPQYELRTTGEMAGEESRTLILIVEDDDIQAGILATVLERAGFTVETVDRGLGALSKIRETIYDVILLDYQVPDIDGFATARLIRDFMGPIAQPILIAVTVTPEVLNARTNENVSLFDFVAGKSSGLAPLLESIRHHLSLVTDRAVRRTASSAVLEQAQLDFCSGPLRPEAYGDNPGPARILVVEDDESQLLLLASVIRKRGYSVETVSDGLAAIHKLRNEFFDLALIDYRIPGIDGLAVARLTHSLMDDKIRPRLLALTVTPSALRHVEGSAEIIFDEIVEKSSDFDGLMRTVDSLMRRSSNPATKRACAANQNRKPA